ncbi:helicase [Siculibacillus lacustris]|uniref:Helicase n=2 Tax=Siculibacillus lacustris TaxID=1549641 RepID=A0A4V2KU82_9HYPH|nr:helicase [Siculibacillus lacustris]
MLAQPSGLIGLPLRLLAREVYGRVVARAGADAVALITGEEKIIPPDPRYWVSTVEAMPRRTEVDFVAIDEVQLAGDLERGHVFTDRILNLRGRHETLLLGAATVRDLLEKLIPGIGIVTRPRMSQLTYAGSKKLLRLPPRSAIVAFSAEEVYGIAELIRRQRGGAAVVMGALSPRTRNAQVELFQSGDVDHLVATDAIGMGLNLEVDHVAFAGSRKYDGYQYRNLSAAELGQIAGRAGRHLKDGTFGVTGRVDPFPDDLVEQLETHRFQPLPRLQWRNPRLEFTSLAALRRTLDAPPTEEGLTRAPLADDQSALEHAARDPELARLAQGEKHVAMLWDVCQLPDYRKIAPANHADLVATLFRFLVERGTIPDDFIAARVAESDRVDGDIDTLSARIAHVRTWTFVANRPDWLTDPVHWRDKTRAIEDRLSDALHESLTRRFVDRRTSVLMRRLRENAMIEAEITTGGDVLVEGHRVGHLQGFRFVADPTAEGEDGKAVRTAAAKSLAGEIEARADRLGRAPDGDVVLAADGSLRWLGDTVARLATGPDPLRPAVLLLADEQLTGPARDKVQARLDLWIATQIAVLLKPLVDLRDAADLEGLGRGLAFQLVEGLGVLERSQVAEEVKALDQTMRASLRKYGVRFGAYHVFLPVLLKPAPSGLIARLWALAHADVDAHAAADLNHLSASGRTSIPLDKTIPKALYRIAGFRVCGERAVRIDILERLADIIRPLIAWKPLDPSVSPPDGAIAGGGAFTVTVAMTSLLGCSGEDFASVLKSLGYRVEKRKVPKPAPRVPPAAVIVPVEVAEAAASAAAEVSAEATPAPAEATEIVASEPVATTETEAPAETVAAEAAPESAPAEAEPVAAEAASAEAAPVEAEPAAPDVAESTEAPAEVVEAPEGAATSAETADATVEAEAATETASDEAAPAAVAEPDFLEIDVWRPGRFERGDRPHGHRGGHHGGDRHRSGEAGGERRPGGERRDAAPVSTPNAASRRARDATMPGRPEGGGEARPEGGRPRFAEGGRGRPERAGPGDRPPRRDDRDDRPRADDRAKRSEKPIDPNSPFAALLALKAELESKGRPDKKK